MRAGKYNFTIEQGVQFDDVLTLKNADGSLVNLTGCTARMKIKHSTDHNTPLIISLSTTLNGNGSGLVLGGSAGTVTIKITATDTRGMEFREGVHDIEIVDSSSVPRRWVEGIVGFSPEVSD